MTTAPRFFAVSNLSVGYGKRPVCTDVSFSVDAGAILLMLGHNGAGKSTLVKSLFGLIRPRAGHVRLAGEEIAGRDPRENVLQGFAFVPQGHPVFSRLTVEENLRLGGFVLNDKARVQAEMDKVYALFPVLAARRRQSAGTLSGGQQQMLAIGMALVLSPRLLILDEPSIGLAPSLVGSVMESVAAIRDALGTAILLVEQNVEKSLPIANSVMILRTGRVVYAGAPEPLTDRRRLIEYF